MNVLRAICADITTLTVDAIVNAANETLLGGGVNGAIHHAAGPGLLAECRRLPELSPGVRCPTGEARLTSGHALKAGWVIHTVGPEWQGGGRNEAALLAACYRNVLALAQQRGLRSLAFPAISCGIYRYPLAEAAAIAISTVRIAQAQAPAAAEIEITFACFSEAILAAYRAELGAAA
jgi:O-acetyl-ADP-ribose deacetylase (regulator of RNase III)